MDAAAAESAPLLRSTLAAGGSCSAAAADAPAPPRSRFTDERDSHRRPIRRGMAVVAEDEQPPRRGCSGMNGAGLRRARIAGCDKDRASSGGGYSVVQVVPFRSPRSRSVGPLPPAWRAIRKAAGALQVVSRGCPRWLGGGAPPPPQRFAGQTPAVPAQRRSAPPGARPLASASATGGAGPAVVWLGLFSRPAPPFGLCCGLRVRAPGSAPLRAGQRRDARRRPVRQPGRGAGDEAPSPAPRPHPLPPPCGARSKQGGSAAPPQCLDEPQKKSEPPTFRRGARLWGTMIRSDYDAQATTSTAALDVSRAGPVCGAGAASPPIFSPMNPPRGSSAP